ncbi:MAG: Ig-like domain-containing protein [Phycisphaeraceae bacterium]|nr:MAG: Ig-like domain-containing protein [Phycisphaeraceae bacterium]
MAEPAGFGITDEASYEQFTDAARTAEYVREVFLVGSEEFTPGGPLAQPRSLAVVAAAIAFAERNPIVQESELVAFLQAADGVFQNAYPTDPGLTVPEHLISALRFARVVTGPGPGQDGARPGADAYSIVLTGFDTDVGDRALELLGIRLPGYYDFGTLETRTRAIEAAAAVNVGTSPELGMMLIHAFMGQAPDGTPREPGIANSILDYLRGEGWAVLGDIGVAIPEMPGVNAAIGALPGYQTYLLELAIPAEPVTAPPGDPNADLRTIIAANPIHQRLRDAVYGSLDIAEVLLADLPEPPTASESLLLTDAQLAEIEQRRIDNIRLSSQQRAAMLANAAMLYDQIQAAPYIETQLDLGSAAVGANKHWANVRAGLEIGTGIISAGTAIYKGEVGDAISGISDTVFGIFGAAENNFSHGVTQDDIYQQVQEVRVQLQDVQTQLNERFDAVDAKLDAMFGTMVDSFGLVLSNLDNIQTAVDQAVYEILEQAAALQRLENLFTVFTQDILYQQFQNDVNFFLSTAADGSLPLEGGMFDSYDGAESRFLTFSNNTSQAAAFAGSISNPFDPDLADQVLGEGAISTRIRELVVRAPLFGGTSTGLADIGAVEPWAHGAAAFTELARLSPWYAADSLPRPNAFILTTIRRGEALEDFAAAQRVRGDHGLRGENDEVIEESSLYAGLIARYDAAARSLQDAANAMAVSILDPLLVDGNDYLDLWFPAPEIDPLPFSNTITRMTTGWGGPANNLDFVVPGELNGYSLFFPDEIEPGVGPDQYESVALVRTAALRVASESGTGLFPPVHWYMTTASLDNRTWALNIVLSDTAGQAATSYLARRQVRFQVEDMNNVTGEWEPLAFLSPTLPAIYIQTVWAPVLRDRLMDGDPVYGPDYYYFSDNQGGQLRIRFVNDFTTIGGSYSAQRNATMNWLQGLRSEIRTAILNDFANSSSPVAIAADAMNDAEALLDAYASIVTPGVFNASEAARGALRGAEPDPVMGTPGAELGLRSSHAFEILSQAEASDTDPFAPVARDVDFATIADAQMLMRSDLLRRELASALDLPAQSSPVATWTLAELRATLEYVDRLAVDDVYDSYTDGQTRSVLDNDTRQVDGTSPLTYRPLEVDPAYAGVAGWPEHGSVSISPDGTFTYTPDPGFSGTDRFAYRVLCVVSEPGQSPKVAYSEPAFVRVNVTAGCGLADLDGDGLLDLEDVTTFVAGFTGMLPIADLDGNGLWDLFDITLFVAEFLAGCP